MANNWERFVILRAGKLSSVKGPGLFVIIPVIDSITAVIDERIQTTQFNAEQALTRDTVPVNVDAVIFWHVHDAQRAALNITDYRSAIDRVAQTSLREMIGASHLSALLAERKAADEVLRTEIAGKTADWGISVNSVEIRDVAIPVACRTPCRARRRPSARRKRASSSARPKPRSRRNSSRRRAPMPANAAALHLRAMNIIYETTKERGATILMPTSMVDSMSVALPAAFMAQRTWVAGKRRRRTRYPAFTAVSARAFFAASKPCMPPYHWMATTAPLTGCSRPSAITSASERPQRHADPDRRSDFGFHHQHDRHQDVADDDDHQIGGKIVGAVVMQLLAAVRALVGDLQKGAEHTALAAGRAAPAQPAPQRLRR